MKRAVLVALLLLYGAVLARSAPIQGATIQSAEFDQTKSILTVHIVNTSHKDISGFVVRTKEGDDVFDFLPQIVAGGRAFASGEVITRQIGTPAPEAEITSVAYADSTAEVTDQRGFDALVRGRTAHLLAIKKVNEVVQQSLADKFVTNHSAAISTQLKQAAVALAKPSDAMGSEEAAYISNFTPRSRRVKHRLQTAETEHSNEGSIPSNEFLRSTAV